MGTWHLRARDAARGSIRWPVLLATVSAALGCGASHRAPDGGPDSGVGIDVDAGKDAGDDRRDASGPEVSPEHLDLVLELYAARCRHALRCESKCGGAGEDLYCIPEIAENVLRLVEALRAGTIEIDPDRTRDCLDQLAEADCGPCYPAIASCAEAVRGLVPRGGGCVRAAECGPDDRCVLGLQCPGSCVARAAEGEGCRVFPDCRAGLLCSVGGQCISARTEGEDCGDDYLDGVHVDGDYICASGLYCHEHEPDHSGACEPLRVEGESCGLAYGDESMHCAGDLVCIGPRRQERVCDEGESIGDACSSDSPCAPFGRCAEGRCVRLSGPGDPCEEQANCPVFHGCIDGVCAVGPLEGEACEQDGSRCAEGQCADGICEVIPDGGECDWDGIWDETFGPCDGVCDTDSSSWVCVPLRSEGETCDWTRDCVEGLECRAGLCVPVCKIE